MGNDEVMRLVQIFRQASPPIIDMIEYLNNCWTA